MRTVQIGPILPPAQGPATCGFARARTGATSGRSPASLVVRCCPDARTPGSLYPALHRGVITRSAPLPRLALPFLPMAQLVRIVNEGSVGALALTVPASGSLHAIHLSMPSVAWPRAARTGRALTGFDWVPVAGVVACYRCLQQIPAAMEAAPQSSTNSADMDGGTLL